MLLLVTTLTAFSVGVVTYGPTVLNTQSITVSADTRASSGKWGEANWFLANDGELIFLGEILDTQANLYQRLCVRQM